MARGQDATDTTENVNTQTRCDACKSVVPDADTCAVCGSKLEPASEVPPLNEGDQE